MSELGAARLTFGAGFLDDSRTKLYTPATLSAIIGQLKAGAGGPLVDIGSGRGFFAKAYVAHVGSTALVIRLDPDYDLLTGGLGAARLCASGASIPLTSGSVGIALCHFVLSRIPCEIARRSISEAARILRPGGQLLAVEPCLGLATYHSPHNENSGPLMSVARRMKASFQLDERDVDENYGLALPDEVAVVLEVQSVGLYIAKWYAAFPDAVDDAWLDTMKQRLTDLEERDPISDFIDAHGRSAEPRIEPGPGLVSASENDLVELTTAGFESLSDGRVRDIAVMSPGTPGSQQAVDFIPVVAVLGMKV